MTAVGSMLISSPSSSNRICWYLLCLSIFMYGSISLTTYTDAETRNARNEGDNHYADASVSPFSALPFSALPFSAFPLVPSCDTLGPLPVFR